MIKKGAGAIPPEHPCSKCGGSILPEDKYCAHCGTRVERTCSSCGVLLLASDLFCPDCGAVILTNAGNGERASEFSSVWDSVVRRLRTSLAADYRITRELGRGGQAAVFLADELALTRQVAIKVLAPGSVSGEGAVDRFRREAQMVANLKHAHIVTIFSVRQIEEMHLFVMQFVEGRSLAAIIADCGQLPLGATRAIAFQVGSALQYAHRRKVIHRDIKPANVLFDEDGNAIVTDFGIAKDLSLGSSTHTGLLMGTPAYMSPEQCYQSAITWSSDQYSLGILIYEMLTARVPFDGTSFAVMQGHTDREPPPIRDYRADCPVELEWAAMRMLAKRPADRWPSLPEALTALGATPLSGEDPIRDELRRLALTGEESRGRELTPTGPRRRTPVPAPAPTVKLSVRVPDRLEIGETAKCAAFALTEGPSTPTPLACTWKSANERVAAFQSAATLIGVGTGKTTIIAETSEGIAEVALEVVPAMIRTIELSIAESTLEVGAGVHALATARDARNAVLDTAFEWSSTAPGVATVQSDGHIHAKGPGSTRISVSAAGVTQGALVFVEPAKPASIALTSAPTSLLAGESFVLAAKVFDRRGHALLGRAIRWETSNRSVATVDANGVVSAVRAGQVTITARCDEASNATTLTVTAKIVEPPAEPVTQYESPIQYASPLREAEIAEPVEKVFEPVAVADAVDDFETPRDRSGRLKWALIGAPVVLLAAFGVWKLAGPRQKVSVAQPDAVVLGATLDPAQQKQEVKTPSAGATAAGGTSTAPDTVVRLRIENVPESLFLTESVLPTLNAARGGKDFTLVDPVRWASSNRRVITVDATTGRVATVAEGEARVIATSGAYRTSSARIRVAQRAVVINDPPPKADPPKADPPKADPPKADPAKADPPKADPPKADPPKVDPPKVDPPTSNAVVSDNDAEAMIATLRGHFSRRDANALRGMYVVEDAADPAKRDKLLRDLSQADNVIVVSGRPAARSDADAPTHARAAFVLEVRTGFTRPRRSLDLQLVFSRSGGGFQPRGFRIVNNP